MKNFIKPTQKEVFNYMVKINVELSSEFSEREAGKFIDFWEAKNWKVGKIQMKDWEKVVFYWMCNLYHKNSLKYFSKYTKKKLQEEIKEGEINIDEIDKIYW